MTNPPNTTAPRRIQRSRAKGWRMPEGAVYVGRPTAWGNPFAVSSCASHGRMMATEGYRMHVMAALAKGETPQWVQEHWHDGCDAPLSDPGMWLHPLRGRTLVCWCPLDQPCHAEVLLEIANA